MINSALSWFFRNGDAGQPWYRHSRFYRNRTISCTQTRCCNVCFLTLIIALLLHSKLNGNKLFYSNNTVPFLVFKREETEKGPETKRKGSKTLHKNDKRSMHSFFLLGLEMCASAEWRRWAGARVVLTRGDSPWHRSQGGWPEQGSRSPRRRN